MLTSKERAERRAQANGLETTLIVGKGGVTEQVVLEAVTQLEARELIKGLSLIHIWPWPSPSWTARPRAASSSP